MVNLRESRSDAPRVGAVVVAAGASRRMGGIDKVFYPLNGIPLVWYSLAAMDAHGAVDEIVLVTSEGSVSRAEAMIAEYPLTGISSVCAGGERRQDSVHLGMERLGVCDLVVVHDGARPFLCDELLASGIAAAQEYGAASAAVPIKDTVKQTDAADIVTQTIPRDRLWAVQTPQVFRRSLLEEAHRKVQAPVTDDASMVEAIGNPVKLFFGSYYNIKVTTPEDLIIAQAIMALEAADDCGAS